MNFLRPILYWGALLVSVSSLGAELPREKLIRTVESALDAVYGECCKDLGKEAQQAKVLELVETNYDFNVIIRRAIGRNWNEMNARQQSRVVELIKQLVVKVYVDGLSGNGRPEIQFGETIQITDNRIEIPSTIDAGDQSFKVLYRLGRMESGWQIFDIVAEDISIVSNYRQQFDDHFRRGNAEELIQKLEELLKKDNLDEDIQL